MSMSQLCDRRPQAGPWLRLALPLFLFLARQAGVWFPSRFFNGVLDNVVEPLTSLFFRWLARGVLSVEQARACPVPAEWITLEAARCRQEDDPVILFVHGGAFVTKSPTALPFALALLPKLACRSAVPSILAVSYSLPAKHRTAENELEAAVTWLTATGRNVIVAGDSAGGHLAAQLALRRCTGAAGDSTLPALAGTVLLCPWLDLSLTGTSLEENRFRDVLTVRFLRVGRASYLSAALAAGECLEKAAEEASPALADLSNLPSDGMLVVSGAFDMLREDAALFASRAPAKALTHLLVEDGYVGAHDLFIYLSSPAADEAFNQIASFCVRRLSLPN